MLGRVLIIAGSDSGGGAGIQADIKTVAALGAYASTAITAVTAQNSHGVQAIHRVPPDIVRQQIALVLSDIGADAIKTGMLLDADIINAIADCLERCHPLPPLVLDPVMLSKSGAALLDPAAIDVLKRRLIPMAALLTPNMPEAEALLGRPITSPEQAAVELLGLGAHSVLLKGGHWAGDTVTDILATAQGTTAFSAPRLPGPPAHGTGCTLASAIATGLAQGLGLEPATRRAGSFVHEAIRTGPGFGTGHPLLNHGHGLVG